MLRFLSVLMVVVMLVSCVCVSAKNPETAAGEVLYHQDFADVRDIVGSGVRIGSASSENSLVACPNDSLEIRTYDSGRVYVMLPAVDKGEDGSFTLEFSFRFTDIHTENGFIAPILTCRGDEPTNISSVIIRADGTVDGFDDAPDELREAVAGGQTIGVRIPVEAWALHKVVFTVGETEYALERDNVLMINDGSVGFGVRNTDVKIGEVYIVSGTDYEEKSGHYAENSYATDESPADNAPSGEEYAPLTNDGTGVCAIAAVFCGAVCLALIRRRSARGA